MAEPIKRIGSIDTLRGLGALSIIVFHLFFLANFSLPDGIIKRFATMGGAAVPLFFAISAFSMAYAYHHKLYAQDELRKYFIRRYLKIAPLFYFFLIVNMWVGWLFSGKKYEALDVFLSLTFLFPFIPGKHPSLVMAGWAIGIEWIFYAVFPILFLLTNNLLRSCIFFILSLLISVWMDNLAALFPGVPDNYFYMNFANHLVFFATGFLAYQLRPLWLKSTEANSPRATAISSLLFTLGWGLLFFYFYLRLQFPFDIIMALTWCTWLTGAAIGFHRIVNNPVLQHIGKISYSVYLTHPIVIVCFIKSGVYAFIKGHVASNSSAFIISCIATITMVVAAANVSYIFLEMPAIRLGKRLLENQKHASR
jgi:peptidoglycan/LPS O-acetylase OafA/YrhL